MEIKLISSDAAGKKCIQHLNFKVHQTLDSMSSVGKNHKSFLCTFISLCRIFIFLPCGMLHNRVVFEFLMFVFLPKYLFQTSKKNLNFNSRQGGKNRFYSFLHEEERDQMSGNCI